MILVLGDGNFSFSASLAQNGTTSPQEKIIATSFEDCDTCIKKYGKTVITNLKVLKQMGCQIIHSIDATRLEEYPSIRDTLKIRRVIFNFPHIGRKAGIKLNRALLRNFFESVSKVIQNDGKVEVTLCAGQGGTPADSYQREKCNHWQIVDMATQGGFILMDVVKFTPLNGYVSTGRRGAGNVFNIAGARTHTFVKYAQPPMLNEGWKSGLVQHLKEDMLPSGIGRRLVNKAKDEYLFPQKFFVKTICEQIQRNNSMYDHFTSKAVQTYLQTSHHVKMNLSKLCKECVSTFLALSYYDTLPELCTFDALRPSLFLEIQCICSSILNSKDQGIFCASNHVVTKPSLNNLSSFSYELVVIEKTKEDQHETLIQDVLQATFNKHNPKLSTFMEELNFQHHNDVDAHHEIHTFCKTRSLSNNLYLGLLWFLVKFGTHRKHSVQLLHIKESNGSSDVLGYTCSFFTKDDFKICSTIIDIDILSCLLVHALGKKKKNVLWSLSAETQGVLTASCTNNQPYQQKSLYPPSHNFHVSFWILDPKAKQEVDDGRIEFTEENFLEILSHTCDDLLKSVKLTDKYVEHLTDTPSKTRTSLCYELVYSSHEYSFSKSNALQLQAKISVNISKYLQVLVR